ncbi:hypothetical protein E2C01_081099 [Portunus trituberculatus]|uniref:Uncharacterized protein n=1 Tax=Portunus trituberculatus TaxID=210409 RepID=A0A5B7IX40_PORTR|nr:hypothetical protein [Portunus trituberculatus]
MEDKVLVPSQFVMTLVMISSLLRNAVVASLGCPRTFLRCVLHAICESQFLVLCNIYCNTGVNQEPDTISDTLMVPDPPSSCLTSITTMTSGNRSWRHGCVSGNETYSHGGTRYNRCEEELCNRGRWMPTGRLSDPQCEYLFVALAITGKSLHARKG